VPHPANDLPAVVAKFVLADLLGEDCILARLAGFEQAAVLDLAVELTDGPLSLPSEIDPTDRSAAGVDDLPLELRSGQPVLSHPYATQ
jgi:hypothetical protein